MTSPSPKPKSHKLGAWEIEKKGETYSLKTRVGDGSQTLNLSIKDEQLRDLAELLRKIYPNTD